MAEEKRKFGITVEGLVTQQVMSSELSTAESNNQDVNDEYESYIDLIDSIRSEKNYDWMSDIRLPEFVSMVLTQISMDADQYFKTRDYVEVYLEDEGDEALGNAGAAKELINRTLNQKHVYHYHKYIRGKLLSNITGRVYMRCWWEQETRKGIVGYKEEVETLDVDEYGNKITDSDIQVPATRQVVVPVEGDVPVIDRFNYDIIDQRYVFTDNKYVYSLQDKDWVIIRFEKTIYELKNDSKLINYFNLDLLKNEKSNSETKTSSDSYNKDAGNVKENAPVNVTFDVYERYGKFWCNVIERDEITEEPTVVEPGYNSDGEVMKGAELCEVIISHASKDGDNTLIRFELTPFIDAYGNPYRPIIRGLCYIHPTDDGGVGDGKYARELQIAIDDTFNMGADRVNLATFPVMKGKKYATEDNSTIYFEPGHTIELENPDDLVEFKISDNIIGSLNQMGILSNKMQQFTSIFPTTMGQLPSAASTTATAVAGADNRSNIRNNYKSMTYENTDLVELYWMIQQMTWTFAKPETGKKLMGEKVYDFNPKRDYYYKPLSQSVESEQSKDMKVKRFTEILGYVSNIQHPDTVKMVNYILQQIFKYMGDEYVNFGDKFLGEKQAIEGGPQGVDRQGAPAVSNQAGIAQSGAEQMARGGAVSA